MCQTHLLSNLQRLMRICLLSFVMTQSIFASEQQRPELNVNFCDDQAELDPILGPYGPIKQSFLTLSYQFEGREELRQATAFLPGKVNAKVPIILFLNGGTTSGERYDWLAQTLASHGFAALMVSDPTGPGYSRLFWLQAMLDAIQSSDLEAVIDTEQVIIGGHSFGGVCIFCLNQPETCSYPGEVPSLPDQVLGFFTLNSHSQPSAFPGKDDPIPLSRPLLMILGTNDAYASPANTEKTFQRLSKDVPSFLVRIEGANHFQAVDCIDPLKDQYLKEIPAAISHQEAVNLMGQEILLYLDWLINNWKH